MTAKAAAPSARWWRENSIDAAADSAVNGGNIDVSVKNSAVFPKNNANPPELVEFFPKTSLIFSPLTLFFPPPGLLFQLQQADFRQFTHFLRIFLLTAEYCHIHSGLLAFGKSV